jgi:uncharacterized membrane protein YoaK (UPF0700 family)
VIQERPRRERRGPNGVERTRVDARGRHADDHARRNRKEAEGPLPLVLFALTFMSGLVDAVSFLGLGRVFVANMTGNVVFLGFALGGVSEFSVVAPLVSIAAFLAGAYGGGLIASRWGAHRGRLLAAALTIEIALVTVALAAASTAHAAIVALALAMGVQSAAARRLAVPDLNTVVLTQVLTGYASEAPHVSRRLAAAITMLLGAAAGAALFLGSGTMVALALAWLVLAVNGAAAWRFARSSAPWTRGTG